MKNKYIYLAGIKVFILMLMLGITSAQSNKQNTMPMITIDAIDADLPLVLSQIAEDSGYNIVTGPNVNTSEKITISLADVPLDQAIDMVVRASGLNYEMKGNSILIADKEKLNSDVGITSHIIPLKFFPWNQNFLQQSL